MNSRRLAKKSIRSGRFLPVVIAGLLLGLPEMGSAQSHVTGGVIEGTVFDESGAILPGVSITATRVETNLARSVVSDTNGRYTIPALDPGSYRVVASLSGFATQVRDGVVLQLGQTATLDFTLKLAALEERVTVVADAPVVDVRKTQVAAVVNQVQINNLPINGRNFINFSIITTGVTTDRTPQQGASATSGLSFTGQRARSNNIMVDGLDNNDLVVGSVRATFSQEAVREFQVLTNSYSAEFGKASGGVVNIVTKSGTNEFQGNAFFFFRDDSLNAKEHFEKFDVFGNSIDQEKAPFSQKQWGGTFGGPIRKDKSFFFLSFERLDSEPNNFVTIEASAAAVLQANGFPVGLGNVPYDFNASEVLVKLDQQWKPNHNLVFRANYSDTTNENIEPFGGIVARSRGAVQLRKDWSISASETDILSNKWVSEARVQVARQDQEVNSLDPNCGGPCDSDLKGGPTLEIVGVASVGRQRFTPQPRANTRLQLMETISYFGSNHLFKAGADFSYIDNNVGSLPLHFGGRYIFAPLPAIPALGLPQPLSALQALALGLPAAYIQGYGDPRGPYKYKDLSLFVQDEWRVSSRLTLKLGARYQKQFWPELTYNVPGLANPYTFPQDNNNLAPRLALAFDPQGDGKTSIHAAYGIFYENHISGIVGITDILDGRDGVRTLVLRLPATIAAWRAPGRRLPEPAAFPSLLFSIDPELKNPFAHHASAGFDRALGEDLALAANFVYVRGKNQLGTLDYNPTIPSLGPGRRPLDIGGVPGTSASVLQYTSFGETWYRGMTLTLNKRFSRRYQFMTAYTLSKAEDNSTDFQGSFVPENSGQGRKSPTDTGLPIGFDPDSEKGPATHDQRHRFVLSGLYQFPGDFQLSAIVTVASGRPYNILAGVDLNGDGDAGAFPTDRARTNPADPSSSVGRNNGTMPYVANVDLRASRRFGLSDQAQLELLFEVFNLVNRTNFTEVNNIFGIGAYPSQPLATFGTFTAAEPPRQIQLALKLSF